MRSLRLPSFAARREVGHARQVLIHGAVIRATRTYFDLSYALLEGSLVGRRMLASTATGRAPVHGYFTPEDSAVLLADLHPGPGIRLLDLGCGIGGIAIDLHRRSGAQILGVDVSPRAIAAAKARARQAGVDGAVEFLTGDLSRPPRVGATGAYAVDSLMFAADLGQALRGIGDALESGGRLYATLLVFGSGSETRLPRTIRAAGAQIERLDNVTSALARTSRARADAAASQQQAATSLRGRLALHLVIAEEGLIRVLLADGRVSRWRLTVQYTARARSPLPRQAIGRAQPARSPTPR